MSRAMWRDPAVRAKLTKQRTNSETSRALMEAVNKKQWADPEFRKRHAARSKKSVAELWRDPIFRKKISAFMVEENKQRWSDPDYKDDTSRSIRIALAQPLQRKRISKQAREQTQKPEWRERMRAVMLERWQDPAYRATMSKKLSERARERWRRD